MLKLHVEWQGKHEKIGGLFEKFIFSQCYSGESQWSLTCFFWIFKAYAVYFIQIGFKIVCESYRPTNLSIQALKLAKSWKKIGCNTIITKCTTICPLSISTVLGFYLIKRVTSFLSVYYMSYQWLHITGIKARQTNCQNMFGILHQSLYHHVHWKFLLGITIWRKN